MTLAVLADEQSKQELLAKGIPATVEVIWADSVRSLVMVEADVYIDLLFEMDIERTAKLKQLLPKPVLVNAVTYSTKQIGANFIRINAWPGMLQRPVTEIAVKEDTLNDDIKIFFDQLQWKYQLVPDEPGMITPRVLSMIINEAYFTLGDEVSSKEEIDIAMKLGTNYPLGPFEWSEKIGLKKIHELLTVLGKKDGRYVIAPALEKEINSKTDQFSF